MSKTSLRQAFRLQRQSFTSAEQTLHAHQLCALLEQLLTSKIKRIGFYWPNDGEISPLSFLQSCLEKELECYLPCIQSQQKLLHFGQITQSTEVVKNQYGIPEPLHTSSAQMISLDLLLMPLVAFDRSGNRLGMGGGYYDYTLAECPRKPLLVGLAHQCQFTEALPKEDWDHPLDVVVTEQQIWRFPNP